MSGVYWLFAWTKNGLDENNNNPIVNMYFYVCLDEQWNVPDQINNPFSSEGPRGKFRRNVK